MNSTFKTLVDQRLNDIQWTNEQSKQVLQSRPERKPVSKRLPLIVALCVALLCITAVALAFTLPGILQRLYGNESTITEKQLNMVQSVSAVAKASGITVSVKEVIYDGQRLAVYWSIVCTADEPILITHGSGNTFNGQRLYQDFSSLGIVEGQVILPGETLNGGFISEAGLVSQSDSASTVLHFLTFTLTKPVALISPETEYSDDLLQATYTQNDCIAVNEQSRIITLNPMFDPSTIDTGEFAGMNQYEAYGLVEYADEILLEFPVNTQNAGQYSNLVINQTASSDDYSVNLTAVTISPITTYFAFNLCPPQKFTEEEASALLTALEVTYTTSNLSPLVFLDGEYMNSLSTHALADGSYIITGNYPLPGLAYPVDEVLLTVRNHKDNTIYAQYKITVP